MPWIPSGGGSSSPLTTKGDLWGYDTTDDRIPIGSNGQVLTADSAQGLGLKWATPSGGGGSGASAFSPIWEKSASDDPPDDEFDDETGMSGETNGLDAKWTAVNGSSGTVDILDTASGAVAKYDLTTRPGWLLIQVGDADNVSLRQDFTLGDGDSVVLAVAGGLSQKTGDNASYALRLNNNDASSVGGDYVAVMIEQDSSDIDIQANASNATSGIELGGMMPLLGVPLFLRIIRDGLTYVAYASIGGWAWHYIEQFTFAGALNNLWISVTGQSTLDYAPIVAIPWVRQGGGGFDPW